MEHQLAKWGVALGCAVLFLALALPIAVLFPAVIALLVNFAWAQAVSSFGATLWPAKPEPSVSDPET